MYLYSCCRQCKPVLPIVLLDLIGSDEDTSGEDAPQSLCQLPESTLASLVKVDLQLFSLRYNILQHFINESHIFHFKGIQLA